MAASVFSELKWMGANCELVTEYAKDKVWENSLDILDNQLYILGKQYHRLHRLKGKVDIAVTDSPLMLSHFYGEAWGQPFLDMVTAVHKAFDNVNFFIEREKKYVKYGRLQSKEEAEQIDLNILDVLDSKDVDYIGVQGNRGGVAMALSHIMKRYNGN